jgi:nitrogen fixation protein FixH
VSPLIRKDRIWPAIIVSVLVVDVGVGVVMMRVANDDPTFAVEPDYYHKAVAWDSTVAQAERNRSLGWQVMPSLGRVEAGKDAALTLTLRDSAGALVHGAEVHVEAMPVAHANELMEATLPAGEAGGYTAEVPITRAGLWELRVVATRGSDRFTADLRLDASTSGEARVVTDRPWQASPSRLEAGTRAEDGTGHGPGG